MIEARAIEKHYGPYHALADVSISVPEGSLTALLGPSGSGKSTLLRVIAGLETPDSGSILIDGEDATRTPARARGVGFVFQHYAAFKHMTVAQNVAFGLSIRKRPKAEIAVRVAELLELVGLSHLAARRPDQLSGGQRQRMALARALAVEPRLLLLDEPFGALDARVREELRDWLRRLHDDVGVTTVFVTHDQQEAMDVAEQIVVINEGRVEQAGSPDEIYDRPASDFVMGFVGPVTRLGDELVRPHDVDVMRAAFDRARPATVTRVARLGFEVRLELELDDGSSVSVQLSPGEAAELDVSPGDRVHARRRAPRLAAVS